jgi:hypothetical protein
MSQLKTGRPSRKDKAIAAVQETQKNIIRMNINIPKSFYKIIKQRALDEDTSITEIVKKSLNEYMSKNVITHKKEAQ